MEKREKGIGRIAAMICAVINFAMVVFHFSLVLGAPLGEFVFGGYYVVLPREMRVTSTVMLILFLLLGFVYLKAGEFIDNKVNLKLLIVIIGVNTVLLFMTIVANIFVSDSIKEKMLMTPLSTIQFVASFLSLIFLIKRKRKI